MGIPCWMRAWKLSMSLFIFICEHHKTTLKLLRVGNLHYVAFQSSCAPTSWWWTHVSKFVASWSLLGSSPSRKRTKSLLKQTCMSFVQVWKKKGGMAGCGKKCEFWGAFFGKKLVYCPILGCIDWSDVVIFIWNFRYKCDLEGNGSSEAGGWRENANKYSNLPILWWWYHIWTSCTFEESSSTVKVVMGNFSSHGRCNKVFRNWRMNWVSNASKIAC